jgi:hypothetical protein
MGKAGRPPAEYPACPKCGLPLIEAGHKAGVPYQPKMGLKAPGVIGKMLAKMKIGDSFVIDAKGDKKTINRYRQNVYTQGRRVGVETMVREDGKGGIRVWRKS